MTAGSDVNIVRANLPGSAPVYAPHEGRHGTSRGINIQPGSNDDGWVVPPPVQLDDGTIIQLYKDGEALHAAYEAIHAAKYRICLEVYIFASDETGQAFAELLSQKARQGVRVYVIYDSFGSLASDVNMFARMQRAGVNIIKFHPVRPWDCQFSWRPVNRDHRKLLMIDYDVAGIGGLNIGREYAGSWVVGSKLSTSDLWRDNAIGMVGPAARLLFHSFARTWHYVTHGGHFRAAEFIHHLNDNDTGLLASVPTRSSPLAPLLKKLVRDAKKSIQLTAAYFAPSDDLINELCQAVQRGVRVQLMLPAKGDIRLMVLAARSFYERLLSAGVEIYERQHVILHAKTMTIDGQLTVMGSTNLDYRSIEYNCELSLMIRSAPFARQMSDLFQNDIQYAREIALREWRRRPTWDRFAQWAVNRSRYLL